MAFDPENIVKVAEESGVSWYDYLTTDTNATVATAGYFNNFARILDLNDKIWVKASDLSVLYYVSAIVRPVTIEGVVTAPGTASVTITPVTATAASGLTPGSITMASDRLLGRDTAGTGGAEELTVGGGIEFSGSGGIQATAASDTVAGKIEIAVQSEMETATSTTLAVTPGRTQYHPGVAKAWVKIQGSTGSIQASYNISSVSRSSAGVYVVTWGTAFSSADYTTFTTPLYAVAALITQITVQTSTAVTTACNTVTPTATDPVSLFVAAWGDLP